MCLAVVRCFRFHLVYCHAPVLEHPPLQIFFQKVQPVLVRLVGWYLVFPHFLPYPLWCHVQYY